MTRLILFLLTAVAMNLTFFSSAKAEIFRCKGVWQNKNGFKVNHKIDIVLSADIDDGRVVFVDRQGVRTELNPSRRYGKGLLEWTAPDNIVERHELVIWNRITIH